MTRAKPTKASSPDDWLTAPQLDAWMHFVLMQLQLFAHLNETLAPFDLTFNDYGVLARLADSDDGQVRLSELASMSGFEKSRMSHHAKRMEARGLVERVRCDTDGRGAFLRITALGRKANAAAASAHVADVRTHVFDALSPDDVAALARISTAIVGRLSGPAATA